MNWSLIGIVSGGCLLFTVWWQHGAIGDMKQDLETERQEVATQKKANLQLLTHIQDIKDLEVRLDKFDADQRKRTLQLKGDLAKTLADDTCARQSVPDATRQLQRADQQRTNDEIRAMFTP